MQGDLRSRFLRFVRRRRLVSAGDHVLVAVSGGVDSMVLLHLLRDTAPELGMAITAAHFDHGMRPRSAADADWLAGVCAAWELPLIARRAPQALYGETAARTARYAFLSQAMREVGARRIATAHHADDQIETVLYRVLRGTGMHGLAGIPVRRGPIIRPLLRFRKTELVAYAVTHDIGVREDPTNETDRFVRNRIRRALIPVMVTVQPQSPEAVKNCPSEGKSRLKPVGSICLQDTHERPFGVKGAIEQPSAERVFATGGVVRYCPNTCMAPGGPDG